MSECRFLTRFNSGIRFFPVPLYCLRQWNVTSIIIIIIFNNTYKWQMLLLAFLLARFWSIHFPASLWVFSNRFLDFLAGPHLKLNQTYSLRRQRDVYLLIHPSTFINIPSMLSLGIQLRLNTYKDNVRIKLKKDLLILMTFTAITSWKINSKVWDRQSDRLLASQSDSQLVSQQSAAYQIDWLLPIKLSHEVEKAFLQSCLFNRQLFLSMPFFIPTSSRRDRQSARQDEWMGRMKDKRAHGQIDRQIYRHLYQYTEKLASVNEQTDIKKTKHIAFSLQIQVKKAEKNFHSSGFG